MTLNHNHKNLQPSLPPFIFISIFISIFILISISPTLHAQVFVSSAATDTLSIVPLRQAAADFNNDAYMEIMAQVEIAQDNQGIALVFNRGEFNFDSVTVVLDSLSVDGLMVMDFDRDNRADILSLAHIGTDTTCLIAYLNKNGHYKSDTVAIVPSFISKTGLADFDNDGSREIVVLEDSVSLGLLFTENGNIQTLPGPAGITTLSDFHVADFNNDSRTDIFVSAIVNDTVYQSGIIYNNDSLNFSYRPLFKFLVTPGGIAQGDIDHNGFSDLLLQGIDSTGARSSQVMINRGDTLVLKEITLPELDNASYFMADFTSDGLADISITGDHEDTHTRHYLLIMEEAPGEPFSVKEIDTLVLDTLGYQVSIADFDIDGDLDLSFWNRFNGRLEIFENTTPEINQGPGPVLRPIVFFGQNEMLIVWDFPSDDHTLQETLTYDLAFYTSTEKQLIGAGFDVISRDRQIPAYGYYGHNRVAIIRNLKPGDYNFQIQAIDNALFAQPKTIPGGGGSGISVSYCEGSTVESIYVCDDSPIMLDMKEATDPGPPAWYSYNQGYQDFHNILTYQPKDSFDVVYAGIPGAVGCLNYKTFFIHKIETEAPQITADTIICVDEALDLQITEAYDSVSWLNTNSELLLSGRSISYFPPGNARDTLIYKVFEAGCPYTDSVFIDISDPRVTVESDTVEVVRGNSITLNASGTLFYQWQPFTWIDAPGMPNPLATPEETITYEVTGWDIPGCLDTATVFVDITNLAFAPTLFTPNNDGKNENFRILNLGNPSAFELNVFDRNGKILYGTSQPRQAESVGWDGTSNGNPAPEGAYFWRVTGNYADGKPVLVNGKADGVVHLMR